MLSKFSYHQFGIKLPVGAHVKVQREVGGLDEFGLLCIVPDDLTEEVLNTVMRSRSLKKTYQIREVVGQTIGRVQYFLNKTFVEEIESGTVEKIEG